jgi:hypothetical protein
MRDYMGACERWLREGAFHKIIFCENSGQDPTLLARRVAKWNANATLEVLTYKEPPYPPSLGKGYGELSIITFALQHSRLLIDGTKIVKVTGRYYVNNIDALIQPLERPDVDVVCDIRRGLTFADSRAFGASAPFLRRYLCPLTADANDSGGVYMEHLLARATLRAIADGGRWVPPADSLDIVGVSATTGAAYRRSWIHRTSRSALHKVKNWSLFR